MRWLRVGIVAGILTLGTVIAPGVAFANHVSTGTVSCSGWSIGWDDFPAGLDIAVHQTVTLGDQHETATDGTGGQVDGRFTHAADLHGSGMTVLDTAWDVPGEPHHTARFMSEVDCPTVTTTTSSTTSTTTRPPGTTTTTDPTTTTTPPVTPPTTVPCATGKPPTCMPPTGSKHTTGEWMIGGAIFGFGMIAIGEGRRRSLARR